MNSRVVNYQDRIVTRDELAKLRETDQGQYERITPLLRRRPEENFYRVLTEESAKHLAQAEKLGQFIAWQLEQTGSRFAVDNLDGNHARITEWGDVTINLYLRKV